MRAFSSQRKDSNMAFFDDFGKKLSSMTSDLSGKAKDFSAQVRLEGEIRNAESEKKELFQTIGQLYFEQQTNPGSETPDYSSLLDEVCAANERIENAKARIAEIKEQARLREEQRAAEREAAREAAREKAEREAAEKAEKAEREAAEEAERSAADRYFEEEAGTEDSVEDGSWTPAAAGTAVCKSCGAEIPSDSIFCPKCGSRIEG